MTENHKSPHRFRVPVEVATLTRSLHPQLKRKVKSSLKLILSDPHAGKSLKEDLKGFYSYKVGRFRIIYRTAPKGVVELITIGPRKTIYEETYKIMKKKLKINERD